MPDDTPVRAPIFPDDIVTAVSREEAAKLADLAAGKDVLELGAYHGFSTVVLASVANWVWSVDWHQGDEHAGLGDTWPIFTGNLARYGARERVTVCRGRFEDEVPRLAAGGVRVDGAFLDGKHDMASVQRDLDLALTVVRPGGFIAFHDYGRCTENGHQGFEVTEVADQFGISGRTGFLGWGLVGEDGGAEDFHPPLPAVPAAASSSGINGTCTVCERDDAPTYHQAADEGVHACGDCILKHWPGQFALPPDSIPVYRGWLDDFRRDVSPMQMNSIMGLQWG